MSEQPPAGDPITALQAALDALPDDQVDELTRLLTRLAALPASMLARFAEVGEVEVRSRRLDAVFPSFAGDRVPPRPYEQPIVEDVVGNPDYRWHRGT